MARWFVPRGLERWSGEDFFPAHVLLSFDREVDRHIEMGGGIAILRFLVQHAAGLLELGCEDIVLVLDLHESFAADIERCSRVLVVCVQPLGLALHAMVVRLEPGWRLPLATSAADIPVVIHIDPAVVSDWG